MNLLPIDALVSLGSWKAATAALDAGLDGVRIQLSTVRTHRRGFGAFRSAAERRDIPLRVDLDPAPQADLRRSVSLAVDLGADLIAISVGADLARDLRWFHGIDEGLDDEDLPALMVDLGPDVGASDVAGVAAAVARSAAGTALGLRALDEETALLLSRAEDLTVYTEDLRFATAVRHGVSAFDGGITCLGPRFTQGALEACENDIAEALLAERRLLRWYEGPFERATRGLSEPHRSLCLAEVAEILGEGAEYRGVPAGPGASILRQLRAALAEDFPLFAD